MSNNLFVSISPHIHTKESIPRIMWIVFASLLPSGLIGVFVFGLRVLWIVTIAVITAVFTELAIQAARKKAITIYDGSAALTGLLLAFNLPASVPLWLVATGAVIAIAIAKQAFGGLGRNIFNPALVGRAFLMTAWPKYMTSFPKPFSYDGITSATPLAMIKEAKAGGIWDLGISYWDLFIGNRGGCIGEVSIVALVLGALYLLYRGYISYHIPLSFISSLGILSWVFGREGLFKGDLLFSILTGGLILGAFFMATDYVTSPLTKKGKVIFGIGCGIITFCIRRWGGYPEGVSYAILLMNAFVPLIDRFFVANRYGR